MAAKPSIAIVGPGNLGSALALALKEAGCEIVEVISQKKSLAKARKLAAQVKAQARTVADPMLTARVVWLCVPDHRISSCARQLANAGDWKGTIALHSSGALCSSELSALKRRGAAAASVHPLMSFVAKVRPSLNGVPFAIEGDAAAVRVARTIVARLGGDPFVITAASKPAYHAWGAFTSPLLVALLAAAERVARRAGISPAEARKRMFPIVQQTIANYFDRGAADAFSGPLIRGDVTTVRKHLKVLGEVPEAKQVYLSLARAAMRTLPVKNKEQLKRILK